MQCSVGMKMLAQSIWRDTYRFNVDAKYGLNRDVLLRCPLQQHPLYPNPEQVTGGLLSKAFVRISQSFVRDQRHVQQVLNLIRVEGGYRSYFFRELP